MDSGASCCISPCREDFGGDYSISYVKITDLSSTNTVAGKGLITWHVLDVNGKQVELKLPGYHLPSASVCLLSPQCLLLVDSGEGGHGTQDATKYRFHLPNGITLDAPYGHANLPVLPLSTGADTEVGFWAVVLPLPPLTKLCGLAASLMPVTPTLPRPRRSFFCGIMAFLMPAFLLSIIFFA